MATITAGMVKELREMTGAGMMECKKALTETDGNLEAAVDVLKKSGAAKAEKKANRIAAEGITRVAIDGNKAAVVEVNSETDFVAKNDLFQTFVAAVAKQALNSSLNGGINGEDVEALKQEAFVEDSSKTLADALIEKTATIGEKLSIRRFEKVEGDVVVSYLHGGGRIGVLVAANGTDNDDTKAALSNVAMQIAAMNPQYVCRDDISADAMAKLREITIESALNDPASLPKPILNKLIAQACDEKIWSDEDIATYNNPEINKNYLFNFLSKEAAASLAQLALSKKDEIVADKIFNGLVEGRISKHVKEISLLDQTYVKAEDGKQTVAAYLKSVSADLKIVKMIRMEVGEGMEKKQEDFAAEVAKQMGQ